MRVTPSILVLASLALGGGLLAATSCGGSDGPERAATPDAMGRVKASLPTGPTPGWRGPAMQAGGARVLHLDALPAAWTLPDDAASGGIPPERMVLATAPRKNRKGEVWAAPLPVRVPSVERRFRPQGWEVLLDGVSVPFDTAGANATVGRPAWRIEGGAITITARGPFERAELVAPAATREARRLHWPSARADGLTAEDFVRYTATLSERTVAGLLLPAPTTADFDDLTLPPGARLRTTLTLAPTPLQQPTDGAEVVLDVLIDGEAQEAGRATLAPNAVLVPWEVDLSAHAGKTVSLRLRTLPGAAGDATADHVLLGAPVIVGTPAGSVRRVLVVAIDTQRPDHLGFYGYPRDTSPELDAWAQDAVVFDQAWTGAPRTRPAFRSATTGRHPLPAVCAPNIGGVFDDAGFATAGIVANIHLNPRFDFHRGFDFWWLDGKADVRDQTQRAKAWLDAHAEEYAYLFLHIMDPHIFYDAPEPWGSRFTSTLSPLPADEALPPRYNRWQVYRWMKQGRLSDLRKAHIEAAYDGEVAYTSEVLGGFLRDVEAMPGETLVVIHSDHGEEFWEHGGFEHNHTLYEETTRAVLAIKPPGGTGQQGARSLTPAVLSDLAPTLYTLAGLREADDVEIPATDGIDLTPALRGEADGTWTRPIPIAHLHYDADRWGVVWQGRKYILRTGTGEEEIYDLAADPDERNNLIGAAKDRDVLLQKLGEAHGVRTGLGWRVDVTAPPGTTLTLSLPAPTVDAGVIDPELITTHPANQVWGEVPRVTPAEVGAVTVSDDGRSLRFVAGSVGRGTLYVAFDGAAPDAGAASLTSGDAAATAAADEAVAVGPAVVTVRPGALLVPPAMEYARMAACAGKEGDSAEVEMLQSLGYVGGDGDGH